ncbi:hypothetical protein LOC51_33340 [Rubrivivax sp. JA1024]|nr:hypothetical protein [Rubrivivax sp. JA1024]
MVESAEIERITRDVVNAQTISQAVVSVRSKPSIDWTGDPTIDISVVVRPEAEAALLTEETPLNILTSISDQLLEVGEDRFPIIHYATTEDLEAAIDDSES